jgi:pimeloyl-ACP methyl ester carboxylesterase
MTVPYERFQVPTSAGSLTVGRWGDGDQVVVASHGITANHLSFQRIGQLLVERSDGATSLAAIDHRGRAGSAGVPGPFGMATHADDLVAVLDHLGVERAVLVGHSMGGFVVAAAAERHPGRVERLVLIDGGVPFPMELPPDAEVEAVVHAVIGPALERLDQRWPDEEAYVDFFRAHPAFQPPNRWTDTVEAYVRYDAVATDDGQIRSSAVKAAVLEDGGAAIVDPESASSIERVNHRATLVWAPRGLLDQTPGLYPPELVDEVTGRHAHLTAVLVDGANHYTIAVDDDGASAVVDVLLGG